MISKHTPYGHPVCTICATLNLLWASHMDQMLSTFIKLQRIHTLNTHWQLITLLKALLYIFTSQNNTSYYGYIHDHSQLSCHFSYVVNLQYILVPGNDSFKLSPQNNLQVSNLGAFQLANSQKSSILQLSTAWDIDLRMLQLILVFQLVISTTFLYKMQGPGSVSQTP